MRKVLVSVAPVAPAGQPLTPAEIARDVAECSRLGAAMVHLHVRDACGRLTPDLALLQQTVRLIREQCDVIVEISTGGVSELNIEQRCAPCTPPWVEANSLNVGSVNLGEAVYQNPIADVRYCVEQILHNRKLAETELFEVGMANTLRELDEAFHFPRPLLIALVVGHPGEMPATEAGLRHLIGGVYDNFAPGEVIWGFTQARRADWSLVGRALEMGARSLRIGFEDSDLLAPGTAAKTNAELIAALGGVLAQHGCEPMPPAEARTLLGLAQR